VATYTTGGTVCPSMLLAFGWTRDPSTPAGSFRELLSQGGIEVNALKPFTYTVRVACPWMFLSVLADTFDPTQDIADLRQQYFGVIQAIWQQDSVGNWSAAQLGVSATLPGTNSMYRLGRMEIDWAIEMRFPTDPSADDALRGELKRGVRAFSRNVSLQKTERVNQESDSKSDIDDFKNLPADLLN